jgi:hypothetical protein
MGLFRSRVFSSGPSGKVAENRRRFQIEIWNKNQNKYLGRFPEKRLQRVSEKESFRKKF